MAECLQCSKALQCIESLDRFNLVQIKHLQPKWWHNLLLNFEVSSLSILETLQVNDLALIHKLLFYGFITKCHYMQAQAGDYDARMGAPTFGDT